jgi:hypothetical protein
MSRTYELIKSYPAPISLSDKGKERAFDTFDDIPISQKDVGYIGGGRTTPVQSDFVPNISPSPIDYVMDSNPFE